MKPLFFILFIGLVGCGKTEVIQAKGLNDTEAIKVLDGALTGVYKFQVDGQWYLLAESAYGISIIKHEPK